MNMVDDATSVAEERMGDEETIWATARVLRQWIGKYGIPLALYTDWKNVYLREPTAPQDYHHKAPPARELDQCFAWRPNGASRMTGWRGMRTGGFSWSGRQTTLRGRPK